MRGDTVTVGWLANQAGLDVDDILVTLWDQDLTYLESPSDIVRKESVNLAKRSFGIATKRELTSLGYWMKIYGVDRKDLSSIFLKLGFNLSDKSRTIPSGSLKKLRAELRARTKIKIEPIPIAEEKRIEEIPFEWKTIGHKIQPAYLTGENVLGIHDFLAIEFEKNQDPISPPGIRDKGLLDSSIYRQHTSFGNETKYCTPELAAAALVHSLVNNHAFFNGNKRTALVSMLVMLDSNSLVLECNQSALFRFILLVAQHKIVKGPFSRDADREVMAIAEWICQNCRKIERGDRVISWRRMEKILREYGCQLEQVSAAGTRMKVSRVLKKSGIFGKNKILTVQVPFGGHGRDVGLISIKKIRKELQLDHSNGVDAYLFYKKEPQTLDDFINEYRSTLKKLAKL